MDIVELRKKYPQYDDLSDGALAYGFYQTNYTDMPMGEFADKVKLSSEGFKQMITTAKEKGRNVTSSSTTEDGPSNQAITGFKGEKVSVLRSLYVSLSAAPLAPRTPPSASPCSSSCRSLWSTPLQT